MNQMSSTTNRQLFLSLLLGTLIAALAASGPLGAQPPTREPAPEAATEAGDTGQAANPPALASLFPRQASLTAPAGELARLLLPPEVLSACRSDLSDLRILDSRDREVPFVVDTGRAPDEAVEVIESRRAELLSADRQTEGRENAPPVLRESYELAAPPAAPAGQGWFVVVTTDRPRFVRSILVTSAGSGDGEGVPALAEGSIYRLPGPESGGAGESRKGRERLRIALPAPQDADADGFDTLPPRIQVTLEGEGSSFLEPSFRYERSRRLPGRDRTRVALPTLTETSKDGRTVVELRRPRGLVPDLLVVRTATPALSRELEVWDDGPGAVDGALGQGTVFRLPGGGAPQELEELEIPLAPGRGDRLRVVIRNGDSPPLDELSFEAAVRRPALLFSLPETSSARLLFGGGRAYPPRYDLDSLLATLPNAGRPVTGADAAVGERLIDPRHLAEASLGEVEDNPAFDPEPALAFAHRAGAAVDKRRYRFRRLLHVEPSRDGLARLTLAPEDLAVARPDLADLRIIDGDEHQWAYLLEADLPTKVLDLPVERNDGDRPATSRYALTLPAEPATLDRVVLEVDAPFFDRPFVLRGTPAGPRRSGDEERVLASGRLHRRPGDPRPVTIGFSAARVESLALEVEDGSDAPLPISRARGRFPLPEVYFPAPEGDYALLLGNPEAEPPSYELARARDLVLAVTAAPVQASQLVDNPAHRLGIRFLGGRPLQQLLLWVALVIAVVVLALFTLRLARHS